jgi:hypothetical protein
MKEDFLDKPNLIEEAQKISQISMNYTRSTTGPATWTNPRTGVSYSVSSGGELALAKKIRDDNMTVFGVLDLDRAVSDLQTGMAGKQDIATGVTDDRPTDKEAGYMYFDTTINKPIWYTGTGWVDATGTTV